MANDKIAADAANPSQVLEIFFGYLGTVDSRSSEAHHERFERLVCDVAGWERPAAMYGTSQSIVLGATLEILPLSSHRRVLLRYSFGSVASAA